VTLSKAVITFITEVALGTSSGSVPEGVVFQDGGRYVFSSGTTSMTITFINGEDSSLGTTGSVITPNLFDPDNYLIGSDASVSLESIEITFDSVGPLVELLGFGANPESPISIPVSLSGLTDRGIGVDNLMVASEILVDDEQRESVITYEVDLREGTTLEEVLEGSFKYDIADASVERSNQSITNKTWDLDFSDGSSGSLTGTVTFEARGGVFDYDGTLTWEDSGFGEPTYECP